MRARIYAEPARGATAALLLLGVIALGAVCSCARRGVPPGGPVDAEPPRIVSSAPDSGQVGARSLSEVCVTFSEQMDKRTVRDVVTLRPQVKISDTSWRKNSFCESFAESLRPATTYVLTVMAGYKDAHGNAAKVPHALTFSTGDSVASGEISGTVKVKNLPAPGIPVWAFDSVATPQPDFTKDEPLYLSQAGLKGEFKFIGLPAGTYLLYAFRDKDANRAFDQGTDFTSPAPGAMHVTPEQPTVADVEIALVDPKEPGGVKGVVLHCFAQGERGVIVPMPRVLMETREVSGGGTKTWVVVAEETTGVEGVIAVTATSVTDSSVSFSTTAGKDSTFAIGDMAPGRYVVTCFLDLDRNGRREGGAEVECKEPHTVVVTPGEMVSKITLELPCPGPPAGEIKEGEKAPEPEKLEAGGTFRGAAGDTSTVGEPPDSTATRPDTTGTPPDTTGTR
jgi:uncharacterized protein (DUF2141 family)